MTPSDTGGFEKTQNHLKSLGSSSVTEGKINSILGEHLRPLTGCKLNPDVRNPYVWVQME